MSNPSITPSLEAAAYLAAVVASSDDAIVGKDLNGNIMSWNPAAERIFGFTASEAIGKHISIIIPPERLAEEDFILGQVRNGIKVDHFETIRRHKSGRAVCISVTVSPVHNAAGEIIGASKVARDVTNIREGEKAAAYLGAIIESSDDAIIGKDLNGVVTSWNKSAERIFGYSAEEIIGRHITKILPSERLDEEDKILSTLKEGKRIDHFETWRRHKDGHLIPVALTVSPIRDSAGNIIGASKISRDISERIRSEENLKEISHKKDEFLANMSHELRTPMNAIIGITNLLKMSDDLSPKVTRYVDTLANSADNLLGLINDLLDFAKIESDSFMLETAEFSLTAQVENVISIANVKAREKNLDLYINCAPELNRYFMGDPLRLRQVLTNLLSNAIKFTEKGSISLDISGTIEQAPKTAWLIFKITDSGIGIAEDKLFTIFEKFVQADSSITRRYGGTGLGLSITKACVEKMGGSIAVGSQPGLGSTFTVRLPFPTTDKTSSIESFSAKSAPMPVIASKNVLLVEDYEPNVIVAGETLNAMGFDYDVARNGFEALKKFDQGKYDVVLMDVQMHEMDGLEATRRIRRLEKDRSLHRTPIIAMTAHVRDQDKEKCLEAGMDDFIPKPFNPASLEKKIRASIQLADEIDLLK